MKPKPSGIESIALRRATVADSDKVRYRVYSSPTESIVVIAESALMAVKVSAIEKPYKIVRDLASVGAAIEAQKMNAPSASDARVTMPTERREKEKQLIAELAAQKTPQATSEDNFKPMNIADLQHNGLPRARILPPGMLSEIIEQHVKATTPAAESPVPSVVSPPVMEPPPAPPIAVVPPPEPELSPHEKIVQMAEEVLPSSPEGAIETPVVLSTDDVEKLLRE